jgi:hypothetical protein
MPTIHMQTEQVREAARQMAQAAQQMDNMANSLLKRVRGIPWVSPTRDAYIVQFATLSNRLQSKIDEADLLALRLNREVDEWEQVASSFGVRGSAGMPGMIAGGGNTQVEGDKKPENMRLLAELIMNGSDPIRIYQIGPNEYLVVIQGTSWNPNDSNNWGSALTTGLGLSSDFQKQVQLALLSLPAGAVVHMAGHSQGGIVAQNLAVDKNVASHVSVKSVTTFGSPYSAPESDATYRRYATQGDIVPYLEGRDAYAVMLLGPFMGSTVAVFAGADRHPQTTISSDFSGGLFGPHSEYSKSPELEAHSMPFNITAWDGTPTVYDPGTPNSGLAVIYKNLASGAGTIQQAAGTASAAIVDGVQVTTSAIGNAAQGAVGAAGNSMKQASNFFGNLF